MNLTRVAASGRTKGITSYQVRCTNCLHAWFSTHIDAVRLSNGAKPLAECVAIIRSPFARVAGQCGAPGVETHHGKPYCRRHGRVHRERAELAAMNG